MLRIQMVLSPSLRIVKVRATRVAFWPGISTAAMLYSEPDPCGLTLLPKTNHSHKAGRDRPFVGRHEGRFGFTLARSCLAADPESEIPPLLPIPYPRCSTV